MAPCGSVRNTGGSYGFGWADKQHLRDQHHRVLQADERSEFLNEDNELTCAPVAQISPLAVNAIRPSGNGPLISPGAWWVGIARPWGGSVGEPQACWSDKRARRCARISDGGANVNDFAQFRLTNGIPVDERLDVGNCELDPRRRCIGSETAVRLGLKRSDQFIHCLINRIRH